MSAGRGTSSMSTGADPAVVGPYLARVLDDPSWQTCDVALVSGGKSNLTYVVRSTTAAQVVLRRPPLGHVLPTAHDMVREHRVIAALGGTPVPVPAALHLCTDESVLGAPFYVMSRVEGPVVRDTTDLAGYADDEDGRRRIGEAVVDVLADLHAVDPAAIGLADFGRPEGYLERQLRRWVRQWEASREVDLPALDALAADLATVLPQERPAAASAAGTVVHGDYRLDNTVLDPARPGRVAAVLDWEMSTLGDPLADLGLLLVYWAQAGDDPRRATTRVVPAATVAPGFPTRQEVAERYAARTGRGLDALPWYVAFGFFKLAVVVAGITARVRGGAMVGDGFEGIEATMEPLVDLGRETLSAAAVL